MKVLNNIPSSGFVFLVGIFLFTLIFRIAYSTPIEFEEDTLGKILIAEAIAETGDWSNILLDHHRARWGVVIPLVYFISPPNFLTASSSSLILPVTSFF